MLLAKKIQFYVQNLTRISHILADGNSTGHIYLVPVELLHFLSLANVM